MFHGQQVLIIQQQEQGLWLLRRTFESSRHHMTLEGPGSLFASSSEFPVFAHLYQNVTK